MKRAKCRVGQLSLTKELQILNLVSDFSTSNVQFLATHHRDLLTQKKLLRNHSRRPSKDMILQINDDDLGTVFLSALSLGTSNILSRRYGHYEHSRPYAHKSSGYNRIHNVKSKNEFRSTRKGEEDKWKRKKDARQQRGNTKSKMNCNHFFIFIFF